jgi:hypothetical protein
VSAAAGMSLTVNVHLEARTRIESRLLQVKGRSRPVLDLEGGRGYVSIFADRAELVRLQNAISTVLADLDSAQAQERGSAA